MKIERDEKVVKRHSGISYTTFEKLKSVNKDKLIDMVEAGDRVIIMYKTRMIELKAVEIK